MRTFRTVDGDEPEIRLGHQVDDALSNVLATQELSTLTMTYKEGPVVTYTAWEYECPLCEDYGHQETACPTLNTDPLRMRNPRWYVAGYAKKDGNFIYLSHYFSARSAEAAIRYWKRWVTGSGYTTDPRYSPRPFRSR